MASIRKRGTRWQAQIRRNGHKAVIRSFAQKSDAVTWARQQEVSIDRGEYWAAPDRDQQQNLDDILRRYLLEVTPQKKGASSEAYRIKRLLKTDLSQLPLAKLSGSVIAAYRDKRLKEIAPASVRRELTILRHCIEKARREWGARLSDNPVAEIDMPKGDLPRVRRVTSEDMAKLFVGLKTTQNPNVSRIILFAAATGMRKSEILAVRWAHIAPDQRTLLIPDSKNGHPRTIPLSPAAISALPQKPPSQPAGDLVFPISSNALRLSWERLKQRSRIEDLRFHDLRHEAISRFFEMGLTIPEVSLISGHKDPRMLFRYTHLKANDVAEKLHNYMDL